MAQHKVLAVTVASSRCGIASLKSDQNDTHSNTCSVYAQDGRDFESCRLYGAKVTHGIGRSVIINVEALCCTEREGFRDK